MLKASVGMRLQSAIEFIITYGWALLILLVMIAVLYFYTTLPNTIVPSSCTFTTTLLCNEIIIGSNALANATYVTISATNLEPYAIEYPQLSFSLNGQNSTEASCFPDIIQPGGTMTCTASITQRTTLFETVAGALVMNISDCSFVPNYTYTKRCTNPPARFITGDYVGHTEPFRNFSITTGYVYCVGTEATSPYNYSYYAPIQSTGAVGNWIPTTNYPIPLADAGCNIYNNDIYCIGSYANGVAQVSTYYAPVSPTGGIGNWISTTPYPITLNESGCSVYDGYLFCVGTNSTYPYNYTYYAPVSSTGIGQWKSTTWYPVPTSAIGCSIDNGYIYCVGRGISSNPKSFYYAPVSSTGIGAWLPGPTYPLASANSGCMTFASRIYCVSTDVTKASYYASLSKADGSVGAWQPTTAYPLKFWDAGCELFYGRIYCIGNFFNNNNRQLVYYTSLTSNGFSAWTSAPDYPVKVYSAYCSILGDSGGFFG